MNWVHANQRGPLEFRIFYLSSILGHYVEETRLSAVKDGHQELTDALKCIQQNGYCWWRVGISFDFFNRILIRTLEGDSSKFDGYLENVELFYGHEISYEDFVEHRPKEGDWPKEIFPTHKYLKVVKVVITEIPISSVIIEKTGDVLDSTRLWQTTPLLFDFSDF